MLVEVYGFKMTKEAVYIYVRILYIYKYCDEFYSTFMYQNPNMKI